MHSNIYSRDETLRHRSHHRFVCYCVESMRKLSNSCPRARVIKRSSSSLCCSLSVQACGLRP